MSFLLISLSIFQEEFSRLLKGNSKLFFGCYLNNAAANQILSSCTAWQIKI